MSTLVATASYDDNITGIGDQLVTLKAAQAASLLGYLKDTYNIEPAGGDSVDTITINHVVVEPVVEQSTFDVILKAFDPTKKIGCIKVVRLASGLGLKEAKELVEAAPKTVKESLSKEDAEKLKKELEDAGGQVELK